MLKLRAHGRASLSFALLVLAGCSDPATTPGDDTGIDSATIDTGTGGPDTGAHDTGVLPTDGAQPDGACPDADGDGARDSACGGTDCDDADPHRFPTNPELCDNGHDEDCDPTTYGFRDTDSDGYVDALCCNGTGATATCGDDCNDMRAVSHPTATEACDGFDNDCDTSVDEGVLLTFYPDADGDGFGNASGTPTTACSAPPMFSTMAMATDCDDTRGGVNPAAMEICDGPMLDENCDGMANPSSLCACNISDPARSCALPGICAGGTESCNAAGQWGTCSIAPGSVTETCNGMDDDCDNSTDEGLLVNCYADTDNDTYPDTAVSPLLRVCPDSSRTTVGTCPNGTTNRTPDAASEDCAVSDSTRHPFASEICNMLDDNCVGGIDEGVATICFTDADGDHYAPAGATGASRCNDNSRPSYGYCPVGTTNTAPGAAPDCDDGNVTAHPTAPEICDVPMVDENCNGMRNEGCNCSVTGAPVSCGTALGQVGACATGTTLCTAGMWGACTVLATAETCNGVDDDCNGAVDNGVDSACCMDGDNDGAVSSLTPLMRACACPVGTRVCPPTGTALDCNDGNASIRPSATEVCNRVDDNCSSGGGTDTSEDMDSDMFAPMGASCTGGYPRTDCNDGNAAIRPSATEVCNGIDDNCVGGIDDGVLNTYYRDADSDTYGAPGVTTTACMPPSGYVANGTDCDDARNDVFPTATELCDGVWNNCLNGSGARTAEDADGDHHSPTGFASCSGGYPRDDCGDHTALAYLGARGYQTTPYCANGATPTNCGGLLGIQCTSCRPPSTAVWATFDYDCSTTTDPEPVRTSCSGSCSLATFSCNDGPTTATDPSTPGMACGDNTTYTDCSCASLCTLVGNPTRPRGCR